MKIYIDKGYEFVEVDSFTINEASFGKKRRIVFSGSTDCPYITETKRLEPEIASDLYDKLVKKVKEDVPYIIKTDDKMLFE